MIERVRLTTNGIAFRCPGCKDVHTIPTTGPSAWGWNGLRDKVTVSPSLLVRSGHYGTAHKPGDPCWCTFNAERPEDPVSFTCYQCHSVITEGRINFCNDSSHELAGQTIDLPEITSLPL